MMISTRGRYALRVMADIAMHDPEEYIPLKAISERQQISMKYLEIIAGILSKAGLIEGQRGKGGGYRLTRMPADYSLCEILKCTEGSLAPVSCLEDGKLHCGRSEHCITLPVWRKLDEIIDDYLESVTLEDLLSNQDGCI